MIKVPARAAVPQEFQDGLKEIAEVRLHKIKRDVEYASEYQRKLTMQELAPTIKILNDIRTRPEVMETLVTKLRSLPYTEWNVGMLGSNKCFYGITKPVIMVCDNLKKAWDMGPYKVYIPFSNVTGGSRGWLFDPVDRPRGSDYFHPHHTGHSTCWGSFNGLIAKLCDESDVVELFRTIYIYLCRYDNHSPLSYRPDRHPYPFAHEIPYKAVKK